MRFFSAQLHRSICVDLLLQNGAIDMDQNICFTLILLLKYNVISSMFSFLVFF